MSQSIDKGKLKALDTALEEFRTCVFELPQADENADWSTWEDLPIAVSDVKRSYRRYRRASESDRNHLWARVEAACKEFDEALAIFLSFDDGAGNDMVDSGDNYFPEVKRHKTALEGAVSALQRALNA
jgi:hypothetical protein